MLWLYVDKNGFYKHMCWSPQTSYNELPILPPELEQIETGRILKACINARAAIAELKTVGELIPDQSLLIQTWDSQTPDSINIPQATSEYRHPGRNGGWS